MAKRTSSISLEERRALVQTKGITLNGNPAKVTGSEMAFAVIRDKTTGLYAEWSWEAVRRIVAKGGAFKS